MEIELKEVRKSAKESIKRAKAGVNKLWLVLFLLNLLTWLLMPIPFLGLFISIASLYIAVGTCILSVKINRYENNNDVLEAGKKKDDFKFVSELTSNQNFGKYSSVIFGNLLFGFMLIGPMLIVISSFITRFAKKAIDIFTYAISAEELIMQLTEQFFISFIPYMFILFIIGIFVYIITMSTSFMFYIAFDTREGITASEILSLSNAIIKGKRKKFFFIDLRFILLTLAVNFIYFNIMFFAGFTGIAGFGLFLLNCVYFAVFGIVYARKRIYFATLYEYLIVDFQDDYGRLHILKDGVVESLKEKYN